MNHTCRLLALLLAALMVCGMFNAVAEMEVTLDAPQDIEVVDLNGIEDDPDTDPDLFDLDLDMEDLALEDPALVSEAPEAAVESNVDADPEERNASPFQIDENGMLVKYTGDSESVVIPDNVISVMSNAFANNSALNRVVIPASVTRIYANAFANCVNLASVTVLAKEISISIHAFNGDTPRFYTVLNSQAAAYARQLGFDVESNLILLDQNYRLTTTTNRVYRIYITDGNAVSYISSDPSVATVNADGYVRTVNSGNVLITVTLDDGRTRLLTVVVQPRTASLSPDSMTLKVGDSRLITVNNLSGRTVTWSSSNANVASVNGGMVFARMVGSCTITARLSDGTTLACKVNVYQPQKKASLNKKSLDMNVGQTAVLIVNNLSGRSVTWSSSNANVASVNAGRVTARGVGSCTITARLSDGTTLTCRVNVSRKAQPKPQKKASLNKASLDLKVGDSFTLIVNNRGNRSVTWSSSSANIASVNGGKVTAKGAGSCTITARLSDGTTLTCKVNVSRKAQPKPQKKASLNKASLDLKVGDSFTLIVNNRGNRSVTWSSNYPNVASVNGGKVIAKKAGSCTITARLSDGTTLTCKVKVTLKNPSLNKTKHTMYVGRTFKLYVNNLGNLRITSWESNNTNIATIDRYGVITALKAGKCVITARLSNGTILQCNLTVKR